MSTENQKPSVVDQFVSQNPGAASAAISGSEALVSATFGLRFLAWVIDVVVLFGIGMVLRVGLPLAPVAGTLVGLVVQFFYGAYFLPHHGGTPGKLALGLEVVRDDNGQRLDFLKAGLRDSFGHSVSGMILGLGFLLALFTERNRALHDFLVGSRVVLARKP